jgi:hypothetical protein
MARHRPPAFSRRLVGHQQQVHHLGHRHQLDHDLGHDAEGALRAGERAQQVIAGTNAGAVAEPGQLTGRRDDLQPGDVVHGEPVLEAVRPARVLRHVAAHRADHLAGRVRRVEQAERRRGLAHRQVGHARLHHGAPADRIDVQHRTHPGHHDQDAALVRQRPAGQAGAAAAGHERHPRSRAFGHHRRHLAGRAWQHYQGRHAPVRGQPVALVRAQLERIGDDVARAANVPHPRDQGPHTHDAPPR